MSDFLTIVFKTNILSRVKHAKISRKKNDFENRKMPKTQDDNAINRYIRKRILQARTEANENQGELADKLKKSRVAISDMERGKTAINASLLVQIAHHYKKSINYFYPPETIIALSALEEELLQLFKELPAPQQYAHIDYIKQQVKNSKKEKGK